MSVQNSIIANILSGARSNQLDNLRPVTPGDLPRHLFSGDDYANRPGSSYKMKSVVGQAMEDFKRAIDRTSETAASSVGTASLGSS